MQEKYIADFFDSSKECPNEIKNCLKLREEYVASFKKLTSSSCKSCDLIELKNYFIAKIRFNYVPLTFEDSIFYKKNKDKKISSLKKTYIFLFPYKIIFLVFNNFIQIISFQNKRQKISNIKSNFIFWHFKKIFLFLYFNREDFLFYFWFSKNVSTKVAKIYSLSFKKAYKYFVGKK